MVQDTEPVVSVRLGQGLLTHLMDPAMWVEKVFLGMMQKLEEPLQAHLNIWRVVLDKSRVWIGNQRKPPFLMPTNERRSLQKHLL